MLRITDHALQTFTGRNGVCLSSQVNHVSCSLTSNPFWLPKSLKLALIISFLYLGDVMW